MKWTFPSNIIIRTWVDIAQNNKFPEAQEIAPRKGRNKIIWRTRYKGSCSRWILANVIGLNKI